MSPQSPALKAFRRLHHLGPSRQTPGRRVRAEGAQRPRRRGPGEAFEALGAAGVGGGALCVVEPGHPKIHRGCENIGTITRRKGRFEGVLNGKSINRNDVSTVIPSDFLDGYMYNLS